MRKVCCTVGVHEATSFNSDRIDVKLNQTVLSKQTAWGCCSGAVSARSRLVFHTPSQRHKHSAGSKHDPLRTQPPHHHHARTRPDVFRSDKTYINRTCVCRAFGHGYGSLFLSMSTGRH